MWFSLFAVILILAVTFYQGLTGLFSAFIMFVCTVFAAALAFGTYENIYAGFLITRQPDHGKAIAFMAVFILALLVMRVIVDLAIKKNMEFHPAVDRAGGGVFGFLSAMIIIGCLAIGFQMLPFYSTFLGYSRYEVVNAEGETVDPSGTDLVAMNWSKAELRGPKKIWFSPDGFTVSLVSHLSANALAGPASFERYHPEFLDALNAARWGLSPKDKHVVGRDALTVESYWTLEPGALHTPQWFDEQGKTMIDISRAEAPPPDSGKKRIAVRASLSADAGDQEGFRFNMWQVRLFGRLGDRVESYTLAGVSDPQFPGTLVEVFPGQVFQYTFKGKPTLDFVFEVPESDQFEPAFLEYKQNARADIQPTQDKTDERPSPLTGKGAPADPNSGTTGGTGGTTPTPPRPGQDRISGVGQALPDTRFGSELPVELTNYGSTGDFDLDRGGALAYGHVTAQLNDSWEPIPGNKPAIKRLEIPAGQQLLQLNVPKLHAKSTLGRAIAVAVDTMQDYYVKDSAGRTHRLVGAYAMAEVSGQKWFELVYLHEDAVIAGRNPRFTQIKSANLVDDYVLVYLFQMPPGTQPVEMHTGKTPVDLRGFNLVAPSNAPPS